MVILQSFFILCPEVLSLALAPYGGNTRKRALLHWCNIHPRMDCLFVVIIPIKNFSLIWIWHHYRWRAAKFVLYLALDRGHWAVRVLSRATPTVTRGIHLLFSSLRNHDTHNYCRAWSCLYLLLQLRSVAAGIRTPQPSVCGANDLTHCATTVVSDGSCLKLKWAFLIACCPSSVHLSIFIFSRTTGPISTKLKLAQSILEWWGYMFIKRRSVPFPRGDKSGNTLMKLKIFSRTTGPTVFQLHLVQSILEWWVFKFLQMKVPTRFQGKIRTK